MIAITGSVGRGGTNRPVDVMLVQYLISRQLGPDTGLTEELAITGDVSERLNKAIEQFQTNVMKAKKADGLVGRGGATFKELSKGIAAGKSTTKVLREIVAASRYGASRAGELASGLGIIDIETFIGRYERQFARIGAGSRKALEALLGFINADMQITDIGWGAYMLATVQHECSWKGSLFAPIEEGGKGSGRAYGNAVTITDSNGVKHTNTYYGRGYVQLTWDANYKKMSSNIGLGEDLWIDPSLALDPAVAYKIMSYGMRHGSFTSKKLGDYINSSKCDYEQARRIINGLDKYQAIAGYALNFEMILRTSCNSSFSDCDVGIFV